MTNTNAIVSKSIEVEQIVKEYFSFAFPIFAPYTTERPINSLTRYIVKHYGYAVQGVERFQKIQAELGLTDTDEIQKTTKARLKNILRDLIEMNGHCGEFQPNHFGSEVEKYFKEEPIQLEVLVGDIENFDTILKEMSAIMTERINELLQSEEEIY